MMNPPPMRPAGTAARPADPSPAEPPPTGWEAVEDTKYSWLYARSYGSGAPEKLVAWARLERSLAVLDAGCGMGDLSPHFDNYAGFDVAAESIRLARARFPGRGFHHLGLTAAPAFFTGRRFDVVVCNDVLEHIPEEKVGKVLDALARLPAGRHVYSISTRPSRIRSREGEGLHLTIRPREWWIENLDRHFQVRLASTLDEQRAFYAELVPRRLISVV